LFKQFLQRGLSFRIATWARTSRRPLVAADKNVLLELGHETNLQQEFIVMRSGAG
jgi:hypothetical protein